MTYCVDTSVYFVLLNQFTNRGNPMNNTATLSLIAGIRERADLSNPKMGHATPDDIDDMIWDIEALIESYREEVMSWAQGNYRQSI